MESTLSGRIIGKNVANLVFRSCGNTSLQTTGELGRPKTVFNFPTEHVGKKTFVGTHVASVQ
jgi:hypothetical protein